MWYDKLTTTVLANQVVTLVEKLHRLGNGGVILENGFVSMLSSWQLFLQRQILNGAAHALYVWVVAHGSVLLAATFCTVFRLWVKSGVLSVSI